VSVKANCQIFLCNSIRECKPFTRFTDAKITYKAEENVDKIESTAHHNLWHTLCNQVQSAVAAVISSDIKRSLVTAAFEIPLPTFNM